MNNLVLECIRRATRMLHRHPEYKNYIHFTFIVQNNSIISCGVNRSAEPPNYLSYKRWQKIHSEFTAWKRGKSFIKKGKFYIVNIRLNRSGLLRMSYPCQCCFRFLKNLGCTGVWYSNKNNSMEYSIL